MKVTTWVETAQEVEVTVSLDDVMAEIGALEAPARIQEATSLLSLCVGAVMKVPDSVVAEMTDTARKMVADAMREHAERYMPANDQAKGREHSERPA